MTNKGLNELVGMIWKAMQEKDNYDEIWIVVDKKFIHKIQESVLPQSEKEKLVNTFPNIENQPEYFLSLRNFLQKIGQIIGQKNSLAYVEVFAGAAKKSNDFERYENRNPFALFQNYLFQDRNTNTFLYDTSKFKGFDVNWKNYVKNLLLLMIFSINGKMQNVKKPL